MNQAAGLDELAAGSAWRANKLKSFKERVRGTCELRPCFAQLLTRAQALALGISDDPAVLNVLRSLEEHSSSLEQLGVRQKDGTQPRPWWADGEYDDERADAANDAGTRRLTSKRAKRCVLADGSRRAWSCRTGMSHLSQQNFHNAYDAFTDAIRLSPLKVVWLHIRFARRLGADAGSHRLRTTPTVLLWPCTLATTQAP